MAWGPQGETIHNKTPMSLYELKQKLAEHFDAGLADFIECIKEGDEVYAEIQRNNHRGFNRYVGRRPSGMTYAYVFASFMS